MSLEKFKCHAEELAVRFSHFVCFESNERKYLLFQVRVHINQLIPFVGIPPCRVLNVLCEFSELGEILILFVRWLLLDFIGFVYTIDGLVIAKVRQVRDEEDRTVKARSSIVAHVEDTGVRFDSFFVIFGCVSLTIVSCGQPWFVRLINEEEKAGWPVVEYNSIDKGKQFSTCALRWWSASLMYLPSPGCTISWKSCAES